MGSTNAWCASAVRSAANEFIAAESESNGSRRAAGEHPLLLGSFPGPDWNTGVGGRSDRSGRSSLVGPDSASLVWDEGRYNAPIGVPESSATAGNLLVTTRISAEGESPQRGWIVAQDLTSGEELWATQLPLSSENNWWSHSFGVRDGQVYASRSLGLSRPDYLYALDASDGSVLWQSDELIEADIVETTPYAENGDLIVGTWRSLLRISSSDGSTVWKAPRTCPTQPGGCQATVSGNRVYIWDARIVQGGLALVVVALDAETGEELYASSPLTVSFLTVQQIALFCDSNGGVYAPSARVSSDDALIALQDTGSELIERWRAPIDWVPWASFGIGPDGSVYSYTPNHELVQLDPKTGDALNTSMPIPFTNRFLPRLAVDEIGKLYLTAYYGDGGLFSFDPDLSLRWHESLLGAEGPALGGDRTLVVSGAGTELRAYQDP